MKRYQAVGLGLLVLGLLMLVVALTPSAHVNQGRVDPDKLLGAVRSYAVDLEAANLPVPETVALSVLVEKNYVRTEDVSGFDGIDVLLAVRPDETRPGSVLARARLDDRTEVVALADGSVQTQRR